MSYWVTVYRSAWVALAVLALAGSTVLFTPKWKEYREYQRRQADAADKLRLEEEELKVLKMKEERFQRDPRFVEEIAHDLGLAKSNEVIFKFHDEGPMSPSGLPVRTELRAPAVAPTNAHPAAATNGHTATKPRAATPRPHR